jgi:DNA-binding NarL/FixJ family response regulator
MAQHMVSAAGNAEKIRVLAAESTRMGSQLLAEALAQDRQFDVSWVDPKIAAILESVAQKKPHILLVSSTLEGSSDLGFDAVRRVQAAYPETKVVLLMDTSNASAVVEAFRAGARGIFSQTESSKTLARCICCVHQGQVWANSQELRHVLDALRETEPAKMFDPRAQAILSKREQEVVCCVAEGLSNREIASRLKLTEHTVKNYLFRIFDKLGVSSRVEVVLYVFRMRKESAGSSEIDSAPVTETRPTLVKSPEKSLPRMAPTPVDGVREVARRSRLQGD